MRIVALATVALVLLSGCARDTYATSYEDVAAARFQDAVDRGWVPDLLPDQASEIQEVHAPLDDLAVVTARLPGGILPDACTETSDDVGEPPLSPDWWDEDLLRAGTPVECDIWSGVVDDTTIVLWTDQASEADAS